ncbi:hypothetical protein DB347_04575 [Opitutaceae bacterium EW11]|nr:hypothetical protein DB347_04575 [Opitutaceae bacterium EW11]
MTKLHPTSESPRRPAPKDAADVFPLPARWGFAVLLVATFFLYLPAMNGQLLWDDAGHVTRADLRSWHGLWRIWFEKNATQQYYPVLHSAFWLEHRLWGDAVFGYHALNAVLHALSAGLFALILRRLAVPGAWLAAFVFAFHPVAVESVAWIAEQKNTLSTFLLLGAAWMYLRYDTERRWTLYAAATALFALALLTKSVAAMLAPSLLVLLWWKRRRLTPGDGLRLGPWIVLGAGAGLFTAWLERTSIGASGADFDLSLAQRCLVAGRVIWFYAAKLVWPADLAFMYPRWTIDAGSWWQYLFPLGVLVGLGALAWRAPRGAFAAALIFCGLLFPVLGFVNVYPFVFSYVADHFQYVAAMALIGLAAAGATSWLQRLPLGARVAAPAVLLIVLGVLTWRQAGIYRDVFTLYEDTLAKNPASWMAHNNLAMALTEAGRIEEAVPHLEEALKLRPNYAIAENNLGDDLTRLGRPREAIPHLERALQLQSAYPEASNNLGNALMAVGRSEEALARYREAIRLRPDYAAAYRNLGLGLAMAGRTADAIPLFEQAVKLQPNYADAEVSWAVALTLTDRPAEAVRHFERALQLNPDSVPARVSYGRALAKFGRIDEAVTQYRAAVELDPENAEAHYNLALLLRQRGKLEEASEHYREALRLGWREG